MRDEHSADDAAEQPFEKAVLTGAWVRWVHTSRTFYELFRRESPRGGAVLARAYLETIIEEALLNHALRESSSRRRVGRALAGGLELKVEACKKLQLVSRRVFQIMIELKTLGDAFAHDPFIQDYGDSALGDAFDRLERASSAGGQSEVGAVAPLDPAKQGRSTIALAMTTILANLSEYSGADRRPSGLG